MVDFLDDSASMRGGCSHDVAPCQPSFHGRHGLEAQSKGGAGDQKAQDVAHPEPVPGLLYDMLQLATCASRTPKTAGLLERDTSVELLHAVEQKKLEVLEGKQSLFGVMRTAKGSTLPRW